MIACDFTIVVMQSSDKNFLIVQERLTKTFVQYKNLSVELAVFGFTIDGYVKHEFVKTDLII
jgi:hypothetical protein